MLIGRFKRWRVVRRLRKLKKEKLIHGWGFAEDKIVLFLPREEDNIVRIQKALSNMVPLEKVTFIPTDVPRVFFRPEDWRRKEKVIRLGISACGASSTACSLTAIYRKGGDVLVGIPGHCTSLVDTCRAPLSETLVQPSPFDGGGVNDIIGDLYECYNYLAKDYITVDQCLFKLRPGVAYEMSIFGNGAVKGYLPVKEGKPGMEIYKSGRTTGVSKGIILSTNVTIDVDFICRTFEFRNAIVTTAISAPGDSGAPAYTGDGKIIGYVVGGSDLITVLGSIEEVLKYFKVDLLTA